MLSKHWRVVAGGWKRAPLDNANETHTHTRSVVCVCVCLLQRLLSIRRTCVLLNTLKLLFMRKTWLIPSLDVRAHFHGKRKRATMVLCTSNRVIRRFRDGRIAVLILYKRSRKTFTFRAASYGEENNLILNYFQWTALECYYNTHACYGKT